MNTEVQISSPVLHKGRGGARPNSGPKKGSTWKDTNPTRLAVINRSWAVVNAFLVDPNVKHSEKVKIAIQLATKNVPQEVEQNLTATINEYKSDLAERLKCIGGN